MTKSLLVCKFQTSSQLETAVIKFNVEFNNGCFFHFSLSGDYSPNR
jgi:hypothetical protein